MKTIWKYSLVVEDDQVIKMPKWAKPLCVQVQDNEPKMWVEVDTEQTTHLESRRFATRGTGHPLPDYETYLGTYQLLGGDLIFHVFEVSVNE